VLISSLNILTLGKWKTLSPLQSLSRASSMGSQSNARGKQRLRPIVGLVNVQVASEQVKAASAQKKDSASQKVEDSTSVEKYVLAVVDVFKTNWYLRTVEYLAGVGSWIETGSGQDQRHRGNEEAKKTSTQLPLERWFRSDHRDEPWTTATATVSKHS